MDDLARILRTLQQGDDRYLAVATIVNTRGSSYRRPGARLLVGERTHSGSISAGCLEADVKLHCRLGTATNGPVVLPYDPSQQSDIFGMPSGCGELIEVLIEPIGQGCAFVDANLQSVVVRARKYTAVTVISSSEPQTIPIGLACVRSLDEESACWCSRSLAEDLAQRLMRVAGSQPKTAVIRETINGIEVRLLVSFGSTVPRLAIFGSESDAVSLAEMSALLEWQATICDDRKSRLSLLPPRVTTHGASPEDWDGWLLETDATDAVIMFHDYERDRVALAAVLKSNVEFIAVVGPRRRTEKLLLEIAGGDADLAHKLARRVHSPAGLDIGAERPSEIALAVLSQMQAVKTGRCGAFLSATNEPIHEPLAKIEPVTAHE